MTKSFDDIAGEQGWDLDSRITVLEGFIHKHELEGGLAEYAQDVADEENGDMEDDEDPEPSVIHEEMHRQQLDDLHFEPPYDDGSGR